MFLESLQCCKLLSRCTNKEKLEIIRTLLSLRISAPVLIAMITMVVWSDEVRQKIQSSK